MKSQIISQIAIPSTATVPTAILLVGYGNQGAEQFNNFQQLAERLASCLSQTVIPCPLDRPGNPVLDGIRAGLQLGAVKFVVLPLLLSPAEYQENALAEAITWASRRWSFLSFHVSPPLDMWMWTSLFTATLNTVLNTHLVNLSKTGVVLAGLVRHDGEAQIEIDGDVAKLGRMLQIQNKIPRVEIVCMNSEPPNLNDPVRHCQLADVNQIVVVPAFLFGGKPLDALTQEIAEIAGSTSTPMSLTATLDIEPAFLDALVAQYEAALADDSLLPVSWDEVRRQVEASNSEHRPPPMGIGGIPLGADSPADEAQFQDLTSRINQILPPRYQQMNQNGEVVSAAPMASAELQFDADGSVAWDQMWGLDDPDSPFCELALAGGPPHRGDLLEPVAAAECEASSGKYAAVLAELKRGIELVAGLSTVASESFGWIGVQCESNEMAIWLLRAIIVENVMVRREGDILYLPAGPAFTLAGEIKNVVTVVAKTVHYWREHSQMSMIREA
ncbi:MAG: CbiX/SirB N-terminal domain-containing protein [Chloroflexota bacterium]